MTIKNHAVGEIITGRCVTMGFQLRGRVVEVLPIFGDYHHSSRYRITEVSYVDQERHAGWPAPASAIIYG